MRFLSVEHRGIEPAPGASCEKSREALFLCEKRGKRLNHAGKRRFIFAVHSCIFAGGAGTFSVKSLHKVYTEIAEEVEVVLHLAPVSVRERLHVYPLRRLHVRPASEVLYRRHRDAPRRHERDRVLPEISQNSL